MKDKKNKTDKKNVVYESPDVSVELIEKKERTKADGDKKYYEKVEMESSSGTIKVSLKMDELPGEFKGEAPPKMKVMFVLVNQILDES